MAPHLVQVDRAIVPEYSEQALRKLRVDPLLSGHKEKYFTGVGRKIDRVLWDNYPQREFVIRAISSHQYETPIDLLIHTILQEGTIQELSNHQEGPQRDFIGYVHPIHPGIEVAEYFLIKSFEQSAQNGHDPQPLDLFMIYYRSCIERVPYTTDGVEQEDAFSFRMKINKQVSLAGILKVSQQ